MSDVLYNGKEPLLMAASNKAESAIEIVDDVIFTPNDNCSIFSDSTTKLRRQGNHIYGSLLLSIKTKMINGALGSFNKLPMSITPLLATPVNNKTNIMSIIEPDGAFSFGTYEDNAALEVGDIILVAVDYYTE